MLKDTLKTDLNAAMKEKDLTKVSTLRLLLSAIQYFEIQKERDYQASDNEILSLIQKEVKKRRESIDMYTQGNRIDLAEKESKELDVLTAYLPAQLGADDIRMIVQQTIKDTGASSLQEMGKVMAAVMPKLKDKADGSTINKIVKEELSH